MITKTYTTEFYILTCGECSVQFGMLSDMYRRLVSNKQSFWCPNGHKRYFTGESDADKAQRLAGQLDMERTRRRQTETQLDYARRARKAVSTRLSKTKQRVGHGVCPCCNRTFKALSDHMASQHPHYAGSGDNA